MTLPPLPEPGYWSTRDDDTPLFTADQMLDYARAALAAVPARTLTDERLIAMAEDAQSADWGEWFSDEDALLRFARAVIAAAPQAVPAWNSPDSPPPMSNDPDDSGYSRKVLVWAPDWYKEPVFGRALHFSNHIEWRIEGSSSTATIAGWMPLPPAPSPKESNDE